MSLAYIDKPEFDRLRAAGLDRVKTAELLAQMCRLNTLSMIKNAGSGHIGSSFSSLDVVTWLYLNELNPQDIHFSSKGHDVPGLYALLAALGKLPFESIFKLRRLKGLPGHPDVHTPNIPTNTGSLGMGISKAKGFLKASRLEKTNRHIYVMTGDGELQEGQFWESLTSAVNLGLNDITVLIDHNKLQSDTWVKKVSDLGNLQAKLESFGWHVTRCPGHDFAALSKLFTDLRTVKNKPKIAILDTVKGYGVEFMRSDKMSEDLKLYPFHSGAPSDENYKKGVDELYQKIETLSRGLGFNPPRLSQETLKPIELKFNKRERLIEGYSQEIVQLAQRHEKLVALDADLLLDCGLVPLSEKFPERVIECGIAEQDMVSQAGALALSGCLPVVHSFSCFLHARANEQIYNNATECRKVLYVGSLVGLIPSGPGHSHQAVRDIAALSGIPDFYLVEPSCNAELKSLFTYLVETLPHSAYMRLVTPPYDADLPHPSVYETKVGRGHTINAGETVAVITYGPIMLYQAYHAVCEAQRKFGLSIKLINLPWLNYFDKDWLSAELKGVKALMTIDNHYVQGGQGEKIAAFVAQNIAHHLPVRLLGLKTLPVCGLNHEALAHHGLDATGIERQLGEFLRETVL